MAGDLNAKHVEWNSRLITKRGSLLRDYADKNSCLIHGPSTPTTVPYYSSATPDVLDIAITKDLVFPVYLITCSALSSDHKPILIDTQYRLSFLTPPDRTDLRRTDWPKFQASLESVLPSNPHLSSGVAIDACQGAVKRHFESSDRFHSQVSPACRPTDQLPAPVQVRFEPPRTKRNIPHCGKCQRYGHTQAYCYHSPRCVKCAGNHTTKHCL